MRNPFVGEIVHFYSFPPSTHPGPQAAIVSFVWTDDQSVNLMVLDPHGSTGTASAVEVLQPGEKPPEKTSYIEFITKEDQEPDVSIKDNTDGKKAVKDQAPNPYAAGSKPQ